MLNNSASYRETTVKNYLFPGRKKGYLGFDSAKVSRVTIRLCNKRNVLRKNAKICFAKSTGVEAVICLF